jgi:hypothetical protein
MKKVITFKDGIIEGDVVRELQGIFPELRESFSQRKSYDEYYYNQTLVDIDIKDIEDLIDCYYRVEINNEHLQLIY